MEVQQIMTRNIEEVLGVGESPTVSACPDTVPQSRVRQDTAATRAVQI